MAIQEPRRLSLRVTQAQAGEKIDTLLPWCSFSISKGFEAKFLVTVRQNRHAEFGSSSKFLLCFKMETSTGRARIASSCISPMNL